MMNASLAVKHIFIRMLISLVAHFSIELEQLDMKTNIFFHENLVDVICMS